MTRAAPEPILDPTKDLQDLLIDGIDVRRTAFIVPLGTPLPEEFEKLEVLKGALYDRLEGLARDDRHWLTDKESDFVVVPLSGAELLALERVWPALVLTKRVSVLEGVPGTRYDVLFTQAARQIGLPTMQWPNVSSALVNRAVARQRAGDRAPLPGLAPAPSAPGAPPPEELDDDDTDTIDFA